MAIENGIIVTPENLTGDIGTLLQTSERGLGNLCRHKNVNMWAKYKPWNAHDYDKTGKWLFITPGLDPKKTICSQRWEWKGGLKQNQTDTPFEYWEWDKPTGTVESPFRIEDFAAYKHTAIAPYSIAVTSMLGSQSMFDLKTYTVGQLLGVTNDPGEIYVSSSSPKIEINAYPNETGDHEYKPYDLEEGGEEGKELRYKYYMLIIRDPQDNNRKWYYQMTTNTGGKGHSCAEYFPISREGVYPAVIVLFDNSSSEANGKWTTTQPVGSLIPLGSKKNIFNIDLKLLSVWDGAHINLTDFHNFGYDYGSIGTTGWNYKRVSQIYLAGDLSFDNSYDVNFYIYLSCRIEVSDEYKSTMRVYNHLPSETELKTVPQTGYESLGSEEIAVFNSGYSSKMALHLTGSTSTFKTESTEFTAVELATPIYICCSGNEDVKAINLDVRLTGKTDSGEAGNQMGYSSYFTKKYSFNNLPIK